MHSPPPGFGLAGFFCVYDRSMSTEPDNGILAQILGQHVAAGSKQLPPPSDIQPAELVTELDVGRPHGLVRIRYKLMRHRHGKSVNWFWTAIHAEQVAG